jgi:hypothetical protein
MYQTYNPYTCVKATLSNTSINRDITPMICDYVFHPHIQDQFEDGHENGAFYERSVEIPFKTIQ